MDIMVDLETLSTRNNAHILSIGACTVFDQSNTFYVTIAPGQNRHIDEHTVYWWMQQSDEARDIFNHINSGDSTDLPLALVALGEWMSEVADDNPIHVWSHGATFDCVILADAYDQYNIKLPWRYYNSRDTRTVLDISERLGAYEKPERTGVHHNALDDALYQSEWLATALAQLRV